MAPTLQSTKVLCKGYSFQDGSGVQLDDVGAWSDNIISPSSSNARGGASASLVSAKKSVYRKTSTTDTTESDLSTTSSTASSSTRRLQLPSPAELLGGERSPFQSNSDLDELKCVQEMWLELSEEERSQLPDPSMVTRHFRAENGDKAKALQKLRDTLQWRNEFGVNRIVQCMEPEQKHDIDEDGSDDLKSIMSRENESGKIYIRGYDQYGRALMYMRPGRENTMNALNNMRHLVWNIEKAIAVTKHHSLRIQERAKRQEGNGNTEVAPLEKFNLMIDYDGFRMRDAPPMSTSKWTLDILQKHYPERMYRAYVLNPPLYFKTFWSLIKPFVDPETKKKIVMVNNHAMLQQVRQNIAGTTTATTTTEQHDADNVHMKALEPVAGGLHPIPDFDSKEYLNLPFHISFGEEVPPPSKGMTHATSLVSNSHQNNGNDSDEDSLYEI